jgi:hypothetical protein
MGVQENEETNRPTGILGCLMAGFEMLGHNWWLLTLPVLLDLFLWLGPQLSISPLIGDLATAMRRQPMPDVETTRQVMLQAQALDQTGEQFNLLSLLSTVPLLSIPSLLAQHAPGNLSPVGERVVFVVQDPLAIVGWLAALIPASLLLGFAYLNSLASRIQVLWEKRRDSDSSITPDAKAGQPAPAGCLLGNVGGKLIRVLSFATGLLMIFVMFIPIWSMLVVVATVINQLLGIVIQGLTLGLIIFFMIHLVFVVHGILLGGRGVLRAVLESIVLTRANFVSAMGLVVITTLIYFGLGFVWSMPPGDSWLLLIGILGNSCIATALITGTFIFYQERIHMLVGATPPAAT